MYFQKSHFIAVTFYIQTVYYQTVFSNLILSEPGPPYECGETLTLRCQSDSTDCCNLNTKVWTLDTIQIVSGGNDLTGTGKYKETRYDAGKYFELTINNLHPSDFGKEYVCLYQFDTSPALELKKSHLHCKPCDVCGWQCYAWACLGTLFGNTVWIICILAIKLCLKIVLVVKGSSVVLKCPHKTSDVDMVKWQKKNGNNTKPYSGQGKINPNLESDLKSRLEIIDGVNLRITDVTESDGETYQCSLVSGQVSRMQLFVFQKDWKKWIGLGFTIIVISFVVCILVAVPVGRHFCFCYDIWDDAYRSYPHLSYIFVGYVVANLVILPFGIILKRMKKGDADTFSKLYYVLLVALSILIIPIPCMCLYMHAKAIGPSKWHYFGILVLSLLVVPIPFLCFYIHYKDCKLDGVVTTETLELTGGKSQSVESGSPEKERVDIKQDKKPIKVVRPQPSRPLPPMHLKTDNTGRAEYSTETEIFKQPALPSINKASDSPRPLPQKPPVTQLDPLSDSTSEKKKKKKRKKKQTKQSDEED